MKKFLLTILSTFIFQLYSADFVSVRINIENDTQPGSEIIRMKPIDTIKDVLKKFARLYDLAADIEIKGSLINFGIPPGILTPDQTVLEAGLDKSYNYILIENPLIDITCRTLTGITFTVQMNLFDGLYGHQPSPWIGASIKRYLKYQVESGIEDEKLKEIYKKLFYALDQRHCKLIHGGKELRYVSKPFRIEGLLADPNITIIIEPHRR